MSATDRPDRQEDALFSARTVALLLAFGIIGFAGMLVLGAYAPDLRSGQNGGAHALSNAATGYRALVELAEATGRNPRIVRDPHLFNTADLLVVTPESGATNITAALQDRDYKPTLFVLPKWQTKADPEHAGWVQRIGLLPLAEPIGVLAPGVRFTMRRERMADRKLVTVGLPPAVALRSPRILQVITGITAPEPDEDEEETEPLVLRPLVTDGNGGIVLARLGDAQRYVLADPDLISNRGLRTAAQAAAALAMLDALDERPTKGIAFDVSFNGFGHAQSPLKLAFEPPFLAVTITLAAALLLVGLNALARFGPIAPRERAIAYGKAVLVDNSAALVRRAGREAGMGARYAAVVRDRAARVFGAPPRLHDAALVSYLDSLGGAAPFSPLMRDAEQATDRPALLRAARALHAWQATKMER
ncbi:DUF4350 domain-containing protein [Sphingomonas radiodurans]|uniref:DUF4350 domain-containing protein n=1 Tax=Sphingomonas radiodurans TaxID=2890321 RepID=UPI001E440847|nr:DUF4350 domain-containing protein [Sphingomonas radiodurans]WBH18164.1 hypothetical protein LLW23_08755 [Sphingomonas radiodurans]